MRDTLRECLRIGTAVTETALRRVEGATREALNRAGIDPDELQHRLAEQVPQPVRENAEAAAGLLRSEAEKAWERLGDGVVQVGVVLETLERWVRDFEGRRDQEAPAAEDAGADAASATGRPGRSEGAASGAAERTAGRAEEAFPRPARPTQGPSTGPVRVFVDEGDEEAGGRPVRPTAAPPRPRTPAAAEKTPAKRAPAKKSAAKKTVAKKAAKKPAARTTASQAGAGVPDEAGEKSGAKRAPAKKSAAKKSAAKKTAAKKSSAGKPEAGAFDADVPGQRARSDGASSAGSGADRQSGGPSV
jgi:hypothetical protein